MTQALTEQHHDVSQGQTMRRALLHGPHDLRLRDERRPEALPGEVMLRHSAVSVCGSDMHDHHEGGTGPAAIKAPTTPGHEFAATVIGGSGERFGLPDGSLVAADPAQNCGHCEQCLAGYPNLCPNVRFLGSPGVNGGLAEYVPVPPHSLFAVPEDSAPALTALPEPLGAALHALDITNIRPMSGVTVLGAGPIGRMIAQVARVCGAAHVRGEADVLEATICPDAPDQAAQVARIGGRVTLVGIPDGDRFEMNAANARRKAPIIKMSRRMGQIYPRATELVSRGRLDIASISTHHYDLKAVTHPKRSVPTM
ncbi:alcohol dehydrogenase catalytic domain-containing protein [Deinococcus sp.]|uniref:zinc-dependent alcohol dehydrogenase n=1 Tax=Deinococcus sp. TaxID=47478 RepID=UPI0025D2E0BF|nr:alcohol dehydrogenase catalytic domain-containing protein [Deinococcus sp.]